MLLNRKISSSKFYIIIKYLFYYLIHVSSILFIFSSILTLTSLKSNLCGYYVFISINNILFADTLPNLTSFAKYTFTPDKTSCKFHSIY